MVVKSLCNRVNDQLPPFNRRRSIHTGVGYLRQVNLENLIRLQENLNHFPPIWRLALVWIFILCGNSVILYLMRYESIVPVMNTERWISGLIYNFGRVGEVHFALTPLIKFFKKLIMNPPSSSYGSNIRVEWTVFFWLAHNRGEEKTKLNWRRQAREGLFLSDLAIHCTWSSTNQQNPSGGRMLEWIPRGWIRTGATHLKSFYPHIFPSLRNDLLLFRP